MVLNYICIAFLLLSQFGYTQQNKPLSPSDTINYKGAVFRIVLTTKYNAQLIPKISGNKIVFVDKTENKIQYNICSYMLGLMINKQYAEYSVDNASLEMAFDIFIRKNNLTIWITNIDHMNNPGSKLKSSIGSFKMERIK
ncbi:MAG: hypothetical protein H0W84_09155 [Bacteroidetes bacterium]|nr:hypothetical protein [Bacteroidota bacterium]